MTETTKYEPFETKPHPVGAGIQKLYRFENGYGASVVRFSIGGRSGSYGADAGLWELAVLAFEPDGKHSLTYDTPVTDDVIGWLSEADVEEKLAEIEALPPKESA